MLLGKENFFFRADWINFCFVILVRLLSQPWRGILDAGVVTGLTIGCGSIVYFLYLATIRGETISISADFPWEEKES